MPRSQREVPRIRHRVAARRRHPTRSPRQLRGRPTVHERAIPRDAQRANRQQDGDAHHMRVDVGEQQRPGRKLGDCDRLGNDAAEGPPVDSSLRQIAGNPLPQRLDDCTVADEQHEQHRQCAGSDAGALRARVLRQRVRVALTIPPANQRTVPGRDAGEHSDGDVHDHRR